MEPLGRISDGKSMTYEG